MKTIKKILPVGLMFLPLFAGAVSNINDLFTLTENIMNKLVPVFIGIAVLFLLYAAIKYVTAGEEEEKQKTAKSELIYGIVALFVMVSVWGLVNILVGTFNVDNSRPDIPTLPSL